jgi:hypothetical protein
MSSKQGTVQDFVRKSYPEEFKDLKPGTDAFNKAWKKLAEDDPDGFATKQRQYIKETHYDPMIKDLKEDPGLDVEARSEALKNAVWSTAVQHGPRNGGRLVRKALEGKDVSTMGDKDVINAVYGERSRMDGEGNLVYFPGETNLLSLLLRFHSERNDALKALEEEQKMPLP